ncbi:restriction endonuclease [Halosegnis longus]|uniref:restriction endonuclease n=1 Tax=Halosegnis longus TaxID=2216012 RepID=UPI00129DF5BD|nr:restriction endonuclease [Halosegnis longus]
MVGHTRREILRAGAGTVAGLAAIGNATASQQAGADYHIGLPLEHTWTAEVADLVFAFGETNDHRVLALTATDFSYVDDAVEAIDLATGAREEILTSSESIYDAAVNGETILLSLPDKVAAFDLDGTRLWEDHTEYEEPYRVVSHKQGFLYASSQYIAGSGGDPGRYNRGRVTSIGTDGTRHFSEWVGFATSFWLTDDQIILGITEEEQTDDGFEIVDGHVQSLDYDGNTRWEAETDPPDRLHGMDTTLAVGTTTDSLPLLDIDSGELVTSLTTDGRVADITADADRFYYQVEGAVQAITAADGSDVWRKQLEPELSDISLIGDALYTGSRSGRFAMRDPATGAVRWSDDRAGSTDTVGYVRIHDGRVLAIRGESIACYRGQRGIALDRHRQLSDPSGMAIGSRTNQLVSGSKLAQAETAISEERYAAALQSLDSARRRQTAIDSLLGVTAIGGVYAGARKSSSRYRHHQFAELVAEFRDAYPLEDGALAGVSPRDTLSQVEVALDSHDSGILGSRLITLTNDNLPYAELETTIDAYIEMAPALERLSQTLEDVETADPVRQQLTTTLRDAFDDPDELHAAAETATTILTQYNHWQAATTPEFTFAGESVATDGVTRAFQQASAAESAGESAVMEYIDAATECVTTANEGADVLAGYDCSAVRSVMQRALTTDKSSYDGAATSLSQAARLIKTVAEAEQTRQSLSLEYVDASKAELKTQLQTALADMHLSAATELADYIDHLSTGTWRPEHLAALDPTEFEQLVAELYTARGYSTQVTRQSADRGIDVVARGNGEMLAIQAKRYTGSNKVGRPAIQKTVGAATQVGASRAVVITTSGFTKTAQTAADDFGNEVELIDGATLVRLLTESPLSPPRSGQSTSSRSTSRSATGSQSRTTTGSQRRSGSRSKQHHQQQQQQQTRCDACGEVFRGELTEVTLPDGSTGYCCPRCEQLIDESLGTTPSDKADAAAVLGVSVDATPEEIEEAYRDRIKECHPDTSDGDRETFLRVQDAYDTLSE